MEENSFQVTKGNPLVSIIVITYNSSKYVLETLESAKVQTYKNIELIVSDDCSTDNTVEICREWIDENKDRFVRAKLITSDKNTGIAPNLNRGLREAKGEWVKCIAGDDVLIDNCIRDNINFIKCNSEVAIVFSSIILFKDFEGKIIKIGKLPLENQKIWFSRNAYEQYRRLLFGNFVWAAPSSFIKRLLLERMNYFDSRYPFLEDYPMWIKLTKNNHRLYYFDKETVLYRQSDSVTRVGDEWVNQKFFDSYRAHFFSEVAPQLKKISYRTYLSKRLYIFKLSVLTKYFCNKKFFFSRVLNKIFEVIVQTLDYEN